jgi:hypothetical protein
VADAAARAGGSAHIEERWQKEKRTERWSMPMGRRGENTLPFGNGAGSE